MPLITITGNVDRLIWDGKGIRIWENYIGYNDESKSRIWTAWMDAPQSVNEGDEITISGDLATKVGTWTPKDATEPRNIVEHSLNNCSILSVTPGKPKAETPAAAPIAPEDAPF